MKNILKETLDHYAPFITKRIKGKSSPWISRDLAREMNSRDHLLRKARKTNKQFDWSAYKRKRNFVKNEIQRGKRNYYKTKLADYATKPYRFWKVVNEIYPTKSKNEKLHKQFKMNNKLINDKPTIAKGFCNFFSSVASTLKRKAFPLTELVWSSKKSALFFEKHSSTSET